MENHDEDFSRIGRLKKHYFDDFKDMIDDRDFILLSKELKE